MRALLEWIERHADRDSWLFRWARKRRGICPKCSGPPVRDSQKPGRREWHPCGVCLNCSCGPSQHPKRIALPKARTVDRARSRRAPVERA